jgi:hypothetical protein
MTSLQLGQDSLIKLCELLGLEEMPVKRIILDINVEGLVTVYTEQYIHEKSFGEILDIFVRSKPKTPKKSTEPGLIERAVAQDPNLTKAFEDIENKMQEEVTKRNHEPRPSFNYADDSYEDINH